MFGSFKIIRAAALGILALSLGACGATDIASRNVPMDMTLNGAAGDPPAAVVAEDLAMSDLLFFAGSDLRVSERNGYYPFADIVWRGDAVGDRRLQIGAMFQEAASRVATQDTAGRPVSAVVELVRFHGVTERTRYSVGGNYNIVFMLTLRDAETGAVVAPARKIVGNLSAPGGTAAVHAEFAGQTEKVRVTDFLTLLLSDELVAAPTLDPNAAATDRATS